MALRKWKAVKIIPIALPGTWWLRYRLLPDSKGCWLKNSSTTQSFWVRVSPVQGERQFHAKKIWKSYRC